MEKRDKDLMVMALFIVLVVAGLIIISLAIAQDASAAALLDGELSVGEVRADMSINFGLKYAAETSVKPVRFVSGDRGIDPLIPKPEIAPNYRDPGDPAPLVGSCPIPEQPTFCYKDGGHP